MKIKNCLELGIAADLDTIGEAIYNIRLHAINLFGYDEIQKELAELAEEKVRYSLVDDMNIQSALHKLNGAVT